MGGGAPLPLREQAKSKLQMRLGMFYFNRNQHKQLSWNLEESSSVIISSPGFLVYQKPVLNPIGRASPRSWNTLFLKAREGPG